MTVEYKQVADGKLVCVFSGRMDTAVCAGINDEVLVKVTGAKEVVFDLKGVPYVASSFLRLCSQVGNSKGASFSITNVSPAVLKVLKISGFDKLMKIN